MRDFTAILKELHNIDLSTQKTALATVVKVTGSSYRSPGARMLITETGKWYGSISGGCLEGDALRKARHVMSEAKAMIVTYDTREESNQNLGISLGCNGMIDVLIEPINPKNDPIGFFKQLTSLTKDVALATIFRSSNINGQRLAITADEDVCQYADEALTRLVKIDLSKVFEEGKSYTKEYFHNDEAIEVFIELVQPQISLIIFGAGFDARPVSALAKTLGWTVNVTDECVAHIAPLFFPSADKLSVCQRDFINRDFAINQHTACVLMSHNYAYDRDVLKKLLKSDTRYIGILGPRKRFDKIAKELRKEGIDLSDSDYERIYSPIGLDIAAETPEEIAVSIISEIQGIMHGRKGYSLKNRTWPIHDRDDFNGQVLKKSYK
jgi:xanthine dehydrogenase accessory factor